MNFCKFVCKKVSDFKTFRMFKKYYVIFTLNNNFKEFTFCEDFAKFSIEL